MNTESTATMILVLIQEFNASSSIMSAEITIPTITMTTMAIPKIKMLITISVAFKMDNNPLPI